MANPIHHRDKITRMKYLGGHIMNKHKLTAALAILILTVACGTNPQEYVNKGNRLFDSGNYPDADINYQKAIQKDSRFGEAYYRLGLSAFRQGKLAESYQALLRASELMANRDDVSIALADAAFASYLRDRSAAALYSQVTLISQRLLQKDPASYDGLRFNGYLAMVDRHFSEAIESLNKANSVKPMQPDLIDALVQCLIGNDQVTEGEKLATSLIQQQKSHAQIYDILYSYYSTHNRPTDAEAILKAKVDNNPDVVAYRIQLASHYVASKQEAQLSRTVQEIRSNPARFPGGLMQVGNLYFALKRYDDALRD